MTAAARVPDPRSGVDEVGRWAPAFEGQRPPFTPGHDVSLRHGAYADLRLGDRVAELADELRPLVPAGRPADEVALRLLALCLARIEAAHAALEKAKPAELATLESDARGWTNTARRLLSDLGMTPTARARLGLDVARTAQSVTAVSLAAEAERERSEHAQAKRGAPS